MFNIAEELKNSRISREFILCMTATMRSSISVRLSVYEREYTSISSRVMMRASKGTDGKTDRTFRVYYYGLGIRGACVGVQPDQGTLSKIQYHAAR